MPLRVMHCARRTAVEANLCPFSISEKVFYIWKRFLEARQRGYVRSRMNNTLLKGLALLELLSHSDRPLTLTQIAAELGIVKSNVHRLMQAQALHRHGRAVSF